jgi:hypothetical protein
MEKGRRVCAFGLAAIPLVFSAGLTAQAGDPAAIQLKLSVQFKLTRTTADRTDIVTAGDVVQLHQPGVVMFSVDSPVPPTNVYKGGKMGQGFGTAMMMSNPNTQQRRFVPEEKCWVTRISMQNDGVSFDLYSDPYSDVRYYGTLKVAFQDKKTIPSVDSFLQTVAEVLTVVQPDDQAGAAQPQPAGNSGSGLDLAGPVAGKYVRTDNPSDFVVLAPTGALTIFVGGKIVPGAYLVQGDIVILTSPQLRGPLRCRLNGDTITGPSGAVWKREAEAAAPPPVQDATPAPAAPMVAIAPPPPPADAPPPTLAVGQSKDQVKAGFGQPARRAKVGTKEIYYYKDMKVTFVNGKVSNVE